MNTNSLWYDCPSGSEITLNYMGKTDRNENEKQDKEQNIRMIIGMYQCVLIKDYLYCTLYSRAALYVDIPNSTILTNRGKISDYELTKNTTYFTITDEIWSVLCEYFGE